MALPVPTELRRLGTSGLRITWSDGRVAEYSAERLRAACPCAGCREERGESSEAAAAAKPKKGLLTVIEADKNQECSLEEIWAVGNYAVGMRWGDGHETGIYTFEFLRKEFS